MLDSLPVAVLVLVIGGVVLLTAGVKFGLLTREQRGIGFEGVAILGTYGVGVAALVTM